MYMLLIRIYFQLLIQLSFEAEVHARQSYVHVLLALGINWYHAQQRVTDVPEDIQRKTRRRKSN